MSPLVAEHVPLKDVPEILGGWAVTAVAAIKRDKTYLTSAVTWQDIFNRYKWPKSRAAWSKAKGLGIVNDPWEFIDSLPEGRSILSFDPKTLPAVTSEEIQAQKPLFDINELLNE
jgi:hypothetical protein